MKTNRTISIIIPVYNCEKYLERCLNSILTQSYDEFEVLLIDDGSTDNSGKICDSYVGKDSRVRVFHKDNGGQSAARNVGLDNAKGEFIGFVDGDDWIEPGTLEYLFNQLTINNADIANIRCRIAKSDNGEAVNDSAVNESICRNKEALERIMHEAVVGIPASLSVYRGLYRHALLDGVRFVEGRINEDMVFCYEAYSRASKAVFSTKIGYNYFMSPQSTTRGPLRRKELDLLWACSKLDELSRGESYGMIRKYVNQKIARSYFALLAKAAFYGVDETQIDKERIVVSLTSMLRKNWGLLMKSSVPVNRKILITAFCLNFNLVSIPAKIYKKLR